MDKSIYIKLEAASGSQALVLTRSFNYPPSAGGRQGISNPGHSRAASVTTPETIEQPVRRGGPLLYLIQTNETHWGCKGQRQPWLQWPWRSGVQDQEGGGHTKKWLDFKRMDCPLQVFSWHNPKGSGTGRKRGPRKLVNIQWSHSVSSRAINLEVG